MPRSSTYPVSKVMCSVCQPQVTRIVYIADIAESMNASHPKVESVAFKRRRRPSLSNDRAHYSHHCLKLNVLKCLVNEETVIDFEEVTLESMTGLAPQTHN